MAHHHVAYAAVSSAIFINVPLTAGISAGEGKYSITASNIACTPLFLKAEPQNTGTISLFNVRLRKPFLISSSVNLQFQDIYPLVLLMASAAASIISSRHIFDIPLSYSSGISSFFKCHTFVSSSQ